MRTPAEPGHARSASFARWVLRAWRVTEWPFLMSAWAVRRPTPSEEPVMKILAMISSEEILIDVRCWGSCQVGWQHGIYNCYSALIPLNPNYRNSCEKE